MAREGRFFIYPFIKLQLTRIIYAPGTVPGDGNAVIIKTKSLLLRNFQPTGKDGCK